MTKLTLALALLAVVFAADVAQAAGADPVFDAFTTVCAAPAADFAAVKAAADKLNWGATDLAVDANMPGVVVSERLSRATMVGKDGLTLSAWRGVKGAFNVSDCAVHVAKRPYAAALDSAKAWLQIAPQSSADGHSAFRFTVDAGKPKALTPDDFNAAVAGAGLEILTVSGNQDGVVLDLMMIKK